MMAKEGVGLSLDEDGTRERAFAARPSRKILTHPGDEVGVIRLDTKGEAEIILGIFMRREDERGVGERGEALERGVHLCRRAVKEVAAACAKECISCEGEPIEDEGEVPVDMTFGEQDLDLDAEELKTIAII